MDTGGLSDEHSAAQGHATYHPYTYGGTPVYEESNPLLPLPAALPTGCSPIGGTGQ